MLILLIQYNATQKAGDYAEDMMQTKVCISHGKPFLERVNICFKERVEQIVTDPRVWQTVVKSNI